MAEKRIETVEMRAGDVKTGFGNPRKITKKKKDELRNSIETFGDFGSFIIDENDNIIGGNMRLSVIKEMNPDTVILCKRLIGYSEAELRAINIKDNTHSGDWDMDLLADWTADLAVDLGLEKATKKEMEERSIPEMELIHYEKYDYVMIVCKNELDYNDLIRKLGIEGAKVAISKRTTMRSILRQQQVSTSIMQSSTEVSAEQQIRIRPICCTVPEMTESMSVRKQSLPRIQIRK